MPVEASSRADLRHTCPSAARASASSPSAAQTAEELQVLYAGGSLAASLLCSAPFPCDATSGARFSSVSCAQRELPCAAAPGYLQSAHKVLHASRQATARHHLLAKHCTLHLRPAECSFKSSTRAPTLAPFEEGQCSQSKQSAAQDL